MITQEDLRIFLEKNDISHMLRDIRIDGKRVIAVSLSDEDRRRYEDGDINLHIVKEGDPKKRKIESGLSYGLEKYYSDSMFGYVNGEDGPIDELIELAEGKYVISLQQKSSNNGEKIEGGNWKVIPIQIWEAFLKNLGMEDVYVLPREFNYHSLPSVRVEKESRAMPNAPLSVLIDMYDEPAKREGFDKFPDANAHPFLYHKNITNH